MSPQKKEKRVPYKGGRTERFYSRINPDVKNYLNIIAEKRNVTPADLLEMWVMNEYEKMKIK